MNRCAICRFRLEVSNQKTCSAPCQLEYRRRRDREAKARRRALKLLEAKVKAPRADVPMTQRADVPMTQRVRWQSIEEQQVERAWQENYGRFA